MAVHWAAFCNNLRELTRNSLQGVERGINWKVTYVDDEGDIIMIRSDPELQESFVAQRGPIKRYTLDRSNDVDEVFSIPPSPVDLVAPPPPPSTPTQRTPTPMSPMSPIDVIAQIAAPIHAILTSTVCGGPNKRLLQLLNAHQHTDAVRFFERHSHHIADRTFLYNGACAYALCGNAQQACTTLERAVMNGYRDLMHLVSDSDLDSIRNTPEYINVVQLITAFMDSDEEPATAPTAPASSGSSEECTRVAPVQLPQPYPTAPTTATTVEEVQPPVQEQVSVEPTPVVEEFSYQSVLTTCIDMGLTDSPTLRGLIMREDGDIAKVLDKLLATPRS